MRLSKRTKQLLAKRRKKRPARKPNRDVVKPFELRRFDAATNNRLTSHQWMYAHDRSINVDLNDLPVLISRCSYLASNNPIVAGALATIENDIVGRSGPRLQVVSENERFNNQVERTWRSVWRMPDPNGILNGAQMCRNWIRMLHTGGSFINVFANVNREDVPVTFGWQTVHPRRLITPVGMVGDPYVYLGIRVSETGRPLAYYISDRPPVNRSYYDRSLLTREYDPQVVQHRFFSDEPEQVTGYPLLTTCIQTIADLTDYDKFVMEAAKNAAARTPYLQTSSPEHVIDPDPLPSGCINVEPGMANAAPMGWQWTSVEATQPAAQYTEYRHERLRELGLAMGMPLMMVLLSSADSNFASAHYDGAVYLRRIRSIQAWLEQRTLNELLEQTITELIISTGIVRPDRYSFRWTWEMPPYVNPEKQRRADRMAVEDGAMSLDEYSASLGYEWEDVVAARQRINDQLQEAGLPPAPVNLGSGGASFYESEEQQDAEPVIAND